MGLFNFFKRSEQPSSTPNQPSSAPEGGPKPGQFIRWDDLKSEPFAGDRPTMPSDETLQQRIQRQGDKLIAMYIRGDDSIIGQKDITVSPAETAQFYAALEDGTLDEAKQSDLLKQTPSPFFVNGRPNYHGVFSQVRDKQGMRILGFATQGIDGFNRAGAAPELTTEHTRMFDALMRAYPTPIEFAQCEKSLIANLRRVGNDETKIAEYEESLDRFKPAVYGKRYEYYQALEVLKDKAQKSHLDAALAADQPRREAELHQLQTPVSLPDQDSPYTPPEQRQ